MAINADTLLDRLYLKSQITKWRVIALLIAVAALVVMAEKYNPRSPIEKDFIARINIQGFIGDDKKLYELIDDVTDNPKAKAVIVWLDTPGGSAVGGEEIFLRLRAMSKKKPVVAVMRSISASAGYMIALGTDYIIAREGTITGSIGVILEAAEVTELLEKVGVKPIIVKSAPLKGSPSLMEKATPESTQVLQQVINDFYARFVDMVAERRQLPRDKALQLSDGRVFGGRSALNHKLIDAIGGEEEAVNWLDSQKHISKQLDIRDMEVKRQMGFMERIAGSAMGKFFQNSRIPLDGLVAIWHPELQ
ncbi:MAG: signal peptide peptidase SppA [Proteobacteria bacterium]|nr:signal peptide peptidase SppA [Pseudomonadota bacterium]